MEEAQKDPAADVTDEFSHLIVWYQDIRTRALRGHHFEPVQLQEVMAYEHFLSRVGVEMTGFDWEMLFRLDAIWMDCVPKEGSDKPPPKKQTRH